MEMQMETSNTNKAKREIESIAQKIQHERDELNLQAHLFKAEAKDEWVQVEQKFDQFISQAEKVGNEAKTSTGDIYAALALLGEEVMKGFNRVRKSM